MQVLFTTTNPHKVEEVRAIMRPASIDVVGLDSLEVVPPEPEESGLTFSDNACIKATYYAQMTGQVCLADDSGLEVDALHGAPGVHSARYAGVTGDRTAADAANNEKLLRELGDTPLDKRSGRFVCVMALAQPDGEIIAESRGTFDGLVAFKPRGNNGFGYDPLLYLPDESRTAAELSPAEKNARSHRGDAARSMAAAIASIGISL